MELGTRVRYTHIATEDEMKTGYFPPVGTLGTVLGTDGIYIQVLWDKETKDETSGGVSVNM